MKSLPRVLALVVIPCFSWGCSGCVNSPGSIDVQPSDSATGSGDGGSGDGGSGDGGSGDGGSGDGATSAKPPTVTAGDGAAATAARTKPEDFSDSCRESHRRLRALRLGIPIVFQDLKRPTDAIDRDVLEAIDVAENFLSDCSPTEIDAWVKSFLARDLSTRFKRYQSELKKSLEKELTPFGSRLTAGQSEEVKTKVRELARQYLERIEDLGEEVLAEAEPGSVAHCNGLGVLADKDFTFTRNFTEFRRNATKYVANGCDSLIKDGQDYGYSIGMSLVMDGLYQEAQTHFEKVIADKGDSPDVVLSNIGLWEALYALGDLEGGRELMEKIRDDYREKLGDESFTRGLSKTLLGQYRQWYFISDFWIPFVDYALGNDSDALAGFRTYVDRADQLDQELRAQNQQLPPVIRIYRDFRAREFVTVLEEHQSQPAKVDFDDGIEWAYGEPLTIRESKGKVLAVLFRQPQNARATPFLRELNNFVTDHPDSFAAATFGFVPRGLNEAAKAARFENMRKELTSLGIDFPGGFDVTENSTVFRTLNATVGTASLIIFDAGGRVAWCHVDPTRNDINLLDRVIGRLIGDR